MRGGDHQQGAICVENYVAAAFGGDIVMQSVRREVEGDIQGMYIAVAAGLVRVFMHVRARVCAINMRRVVHEYYSVCGTSSPL